MTPERRLCAARSEREPSASSDWRTSPARACVLHTGAHIARASGHVYAACVHLDGEARISRDGAAIALRRGDIFVTDSRQKFSLDLDRTWRHLLITLPTRFLDSRVARPD